jgi:hypothetical protein
MAILRPGCTKMWHHIAVRIIARWRRCQMHQS